MVRLRWGLVEAVLEDGTACQRLRVVVEGERATAVNFPLLTGAARRGLRALLNTTAVSLGLGSGGEHFVLALEGVEQDLRPGGHIMKLRYTPLQLKVWAVEEPGSPWRAALEACPDLAGMPVVVGSLHAQVLPACLGFHSVAGPGRRLAYVMTDGGALPAQLSRSVAALRQRGLLAGVITCGHAFGGDLEAVNLYSALLAARAILLADAAIVAMGPGVVGTGTKWGTTALEQAWALDAVGVLRGVAVAVVRMSFADPRPRHQGVSHHTLTVLGEAVHRPVEVPIPELPAPQAERVASQLAQAGITLRHRVRVMPAGPLVTALARWEQEGGVPLRSMGRGLAQDPALFLAGAAAGAAAGLLLPGASGLGTSGLADGAGA